MKIFHKIGKIPRKLRYDFYFQLDFSYVDLTTCTCWALWNLYSTFYKEIIWSLWLYQPSGGWIDRLKIGPFKHVKRFFGADHFLLYFRTALDRHTIHTIYVQACKYISWILLTWLSRYRDNLTIAILLLSSMNIARFLKKYYAWYILW